MDELFSWLLHRSVTASCTILAVLLMRFLLRRAPKKYSYVLWTAVAFRLCCPLAFPSAISLFNLLRPVREIAAPDSAISLQGPGPWSAALTAAAYLWFAGLLIFLARGAFSYIRLSGKLRTAIRLKDQVYQSEYVQSPFILGLIHPKIYIPFHLEPQTLHYVLLHEKYHLKRHDHLIKTGAYLLLAMYWFNPMCWLSFYLLNKDMEMSCDEYVLGRKGNTAGDYSEALLSFALRRRFPAPVPLAFGETNIQKRILHILHWKRPRIWISLLSAATCLAVLAVCTTDPAEAESDFSSGEPLWLEETPDRNDSPDYADDAQQTWPNTDNTPDYRRFSQQETPDYDNNAQQIEPYAEDSSDYGNNDQETEPFTEDSSDYGDNPQQTEPFTEDSQDYGDAPQQMPPDYDYDSQQIVPDTDTSQGNVSPSDEVAGEQASFCMDDSSEYAHHRSRRQQCHHGQK